MASFDFITTKPFRESLQADFDEMQRCSNLQAWKSVHVLAGSMVEALLVEQLLIAGSNPDPLKMDLVQAVSACKAEKIISDRSADLCSVIRSYRNLIHPGRAVRMGEPQPTEQSASIASALVGMITTEIANVRRQTQGFTAEQITTKLKADPDAVALLKHLLPEVNGHEKERLLLEGHLVNARSRAVSDIDNATFEDVDQELPRRLQAGFRAILAAAPDDLKRKVAAQFVTILREGDGDTIKSYATAFFRPEDLAFVAADRVDMVRDYLVSQMPPVFTDDAEIARFAGLAKFMSLAHLNQWLSPYVKTIIQMKTSVDIRVKARNALAAEASVASPDGSKAIKRRLDSYISSFSEDPKWAEVVERLQDLKSAIDDDEIPF